MPIRRQSIALILLGCVTMAMAQRTPAPVSPTTDKTDAARYLLKTVEAEAQSFDGPLKAAVLFALGNTYGSVDREKSLDLLSAAYDVVNRLPEDVGPDVKALAFDIVSTTAKVAPGTAEHSLPSDPVMRDYALVEIVHRYISDRKWAAAEQYYERIETEPEVYSAAREFLEAVPRSKQELSNQVFFHALRVFGSQQHGDITAGQPEDLGSLLVRFYDRFPRDSVLEAVDELLRQAKPDNAPEHSQVRNSTISAKTADATMTFSSFYEFRLFQILPILEALDPQHADKLLNDAQNMRTLLAKYPDGQRSIDPDFKGQSSNTDYAIIPLNASATGPVTAAGAIGQMESQRASDRIIQKAETAPELALPAAEAAPIDVKVPALLGIAQMYVKRKPGIAKEALADLMSATKDDSTGRQWRATREAAELFLQMGDKDSAAKACSQASKLIVALYKQDSDTDDPNTALKLFWPSVHAWRDVIDTTSKISVQSTFDLLKQIPDQEIQVLEEVMVASVWVNAPLWRDFSPMTFHKNR